MVVTCFFCQNLLSDFIEEILPASRHEEIKGHLGKCQKCHQIHQELLKAITILRELSAPSQSPEFSVRIVEAAESGRSMALRPLKASRFILGYTVPVLAVIGILVASSKIFPWVEWLKNRSQEKQFARYFPMSNGAAEIIEEQAAWINQREPKMGSLWEEGGISPEDFEKTFQKKGLPNEVNQK